MVPQSQPGLGIGDILTTDRIILNARPANKAQLLAEAARHLASAEQGLAAETIKQALQEREALGSTGLGRGFALPHARIDHLETYQGLFLRLSRPAEFEAIDARPVDLVFVLLIPSVTTMGHVSILAAISRRFRDAEAVANIRRAETREAIFSLLTVPDPPAA